LISLKFREEFPSRLKVVGELSWSVQELLTALSGRGWVKRLPAAPGLAAVFRRLLDSLPQPAGRKLLVNPDLVRPSSVQLVDSRVHIMPWMRSTLCHHLALIPPISTKVKEALDEMLAASLVVERFGGLRELTSNDVSPQTLQSFLNALAPLLRPPPAGMSMEDVLAEVRTQSLVKSRRKALRLSHH